jgi:hypothetical protein
MNVLDGGTTFIQIKAHHREKNIHLRNTTPKELSQFFTKVNVILAAK